MRKKLFKCMICIAILLFMSAPVLEVQAAVRLSQTKLTLVENTKKKLTLKGSKSGVKWTSSNKDIVRVSKNGVVSAIKEGKATVKATYHKKKYSCKVTVIAEVKEEETNEFEYLNEFVAPLGAENVQITDNVITLQNDVTGKVNFDYPDKTAVIDLNGHTWTASGDDFVGAITLVAGNLTVKDSIGTGRISTTGKLSAIAAWGNTKNFDSNLVIESGNFSSNKWRVIYANGPATSVTINGGRFDGIDCDTLSLHNQYVTITGGYFHSFYSCMISAQKEVNISGGTFIADGTGNYARGLSIQNMYTCKVNISGGEYIAPSDECGLYIYNEKNSLDLYDNLNISGGSFSSVFTMLHDCGLTSQQESDEENSAQAMDLANQLLFKNGNIKSIDEAKFVDNTKLILRNVQL